MDLCWLAAEQVIPPSPWLVGKLLANQNLDNAIKPFCIMGGSGNASFILIYVIDTNEGTKMTRVMIQDMFVFFLTYCTIVIY